MTALPSADPLLVADAIAALPSRLRARLDSAVAASATWVIDGSIVRLPGEVEVTLAPLDGVLSEPDHVRCSCLLAPTCLHRASVLAAAPVTTGKNVASAVLAGQTAVPVDPPWSDHERAVAELIAAAAARVLDAGVPGAGAALQGELLRTVHLARLAGLHRVAGATTRVVTRLWSARADDVSFSLADLTSDLLEVLEGAHVIRTAAGDPAVWRGHARSRYQPVGGLRLTGLCLEPVVSSAGYAGVVVWLIDADGRIWSVSDVKPGGPDRVAAAARAGVIIGEVGLSHWELSRAGMILSGATANPAGRLGAGAGVRAVRTDGTSWGDGALAGRFGPVPSDPTGLLLLALTVCGSSEDAVLAVDDLGIGVRLVAPGSAHDTTYRDNLRILGAAPGLRLLAVGRVPPRRAAMIELFAVGGGDLRLPDTYAGHADIGIDRLSRDFVQPTSAAPPFPRRAEAPDPLTPLRRRLQRVVSGGRATLAVLATSTEGRAEVAALRRAQLAAGADRLDRLIQAGQPRERDTFGRLAGDDPTALSRAWLAAGVYEREVAMRLRAEAWATASASTRASG